MALWRPVLPFESYTGNRKKSYVGYEQGAGHGKQALVNTVKGFSNSVGKSVTSVVHRKNQSPAEDERALLAQ